MTNYAVIAVGNNTVTNIVVWNGDSSTWGPGKGYTTVKLQSNQWCDIDAVYNKEINTFAFPNGYTKPGTEE